MLGRDNNPKVRQNKDLGRLDNQHTRAIKSINPLEQTIESEYNVWAISKKIITEK